MKNYNLSKEELQEIALKQNKSIEEVEKDYKYALKDLEYTNKEINSIIDNFNYTRFPNTIHINEYGKKDELNTKYLCCDNLEIFNEIKPEDLAIVTGFGPTNSPTAGTLSAIFRVLELQKETGIYTHIIISELSALNSRQKPFDELLKNTYQFITFIKKLGFDESNGEIRTHNYLDHSRTFSIISSVLKIEDFLEHSEATDDMYKRLNLLGNDYSTMVSQVYTTADIVLPVIRDKKKGVIVPAGLEEHHYPYLARVVIERMKNKKGGVNDLVKHNPEVGAVYGKLISGFFPYVKMSKSIKESSINLGDSKEELYNKIINCGKRNEEVILQMMLLASNWDAEKIKSAKEAYQNLSLNYENWKKLKIDYYKFFLKIKELWDESLHEEAIDTYEGLFC